MEATMATKTPISIRLDSDLLKLLDKARETEGSLYWDRDRTWLIEHAIEETFSTFKNGHLTKKEASEKRPL